MALQSSSYHKTPIKYNDGLRRLSKSAITFLYQKGRGIAEDKIDDIYVYIYIWFCLLFIKCSNSCVHADGFDNGHGAQKIIIH